MIIPRIQQELECFLVTPFDEVIVLAQAEVALRLLDVSTFNEAPLREELYKHTLATGAKGSPNAGESARSSSVRSPRSRADSPPAAATGAMDLLFLGMEDGAFLGYDPISTAGAGEPDTLVWRPPGPAAAADLPWAPFSVGEAGLDQVGPGFGLVVRESCPANLGACEQSAAQGGGCCDRDLRGVYSTSAATLGAPDQLRKWTAPYDPRVRPWYANSKERFESSGGATTLGWSPVYTGALSGERLITATGAIIEPTQPGTFRGVFAVDYRLKQLEEILLRAIRGGAPQGPSNSSSPWAFIIDRATGDFLGEASTAPAADQLMMEAARQHLNATGYAAGTLHGSRRGWAVVVRGFSSDCVGRYVGRDRGGGTGSGRRRSADLRGDSLGVRPSGCVLLAAASKRLREPAPERFCIADVPLFARPNRGVAVPHGVPLAPVWSLRGVR